MNDEELMEIQIWKLAKKFIQRFPSFAKYFDNDFDDYLSSITLGALKSKHTYNSEKGKLGTWCFQCFKTTVFSKRRKIKQYTISLNDTVGENSNVELQEVIAENEDNDEDFYETLNIKINCDKIIPHMSKELYSHFFEHKSISDIARLSGTTTQNIYNKLSRELFQLKKFIETNNEEYLQLSHRADNRKEKEEYLKTHKCSVRTYYRRKAEGKLWNL